MDTVLVLILIGFGCGLHHIVEDEIIFQILYPCEVDHCRNVHGNKGLYLVVVEVTNERSALCLLITEI